MICPQRDFVARMPWPANPAIDLVSRIPIVPGAVRFASMTEYRFTLLPRLFVLGGNAPQSRWRTNVLAGRAEAGWASRASRAFG